MVVCVERQVWFGCDTCSKTAIVDSGNKQTAIKIMRGCGWKIGKNTICNECVTKKVKL